MTEFFPRGIFYDRPDLDEHVRAWYVSHLKASEETPLTIGYAEGTERFRFIWLRSFHQPVIIRIERRDREASLVAKVLSGLGGYEPGRIFKERSKKITLEEWDSFIALLDEADYWKMKKTEGGGLDGAQWVVEGITDQGYHLVDRFSPSGSFADACLYLLRLSGIRVDPDEVY